MPQKKTTMSSTGQINRENEPRVARSVIKYRKTKEMLEDETDN